MMSKETSGRVESLYTAEKAGADMVSQVWVAVIKDLGISGASLGTTADRYASGLGAYSRGKRETIRHLSLISSEAIQLANAGLEEPYEEWETRRNVVTSNIDLNELVGREFSIGQVVLRGVELCEPCKRPEIISKKPGFARAFEDKGGLRAQVLESGIVVVGAKIEK